MAPAEEKFTEIFSLSQNPALMEVGGGHGQKGVDFQRYWAILRIFELKEGGTSDFLLLFESIQDVAEFDSETSPSRVDIYQIKKKDGGEWSFNDLTGILKPDGRKKKVAPTLSKVEKSPVGKLYKAGLAIQQLDANAHFVSNAGCDLPLAKSGTASSLLKCLASELDMSHASSLAEGLALLHATPGEVPDLKRLVLRKTTLHPDNPHLLALGAAAAYLSKHLPTSAGQAKAFVDALFVQLSALGRQTEPVTSFGELRRQRGYSMAELDAALADLKGVPDLKSHLDSVLDGLSLEGLAPLKRISVNIGVTKYFSALVSGTWGADELALIDECAKAAPSLMGSAPLFPALEAETARIAAMYTAFKETEVFAYLLIQVTKNAAA
ncbi:dsDNA nuclease domain-containing protein [Burkholderia sp. 567]|uniref:dsDNA nuclease domain-containing protein n=1 Tax=Burkholderia sp. 567 TaxID=3156413 RepID=UPI0033975039